MVDILQTGLSALLTSQRALSLVSHNIANASQPDYTRQRPELAAVMPASATQVVGPRIGAGVELQGIDRIYDKFLTEQLRDATSDQHRAEEYFRLVGMLEDRLGGAENGLLTELQGFFNGLQDLANTPAGRPERTVVLQRAELLVQRFEDVDRGLRDLTRATEDGIEDAVTNINAMVQSLARFNEEISVGEHQARGSVNDLRDRRDAVLRDLSKEIGIQTTEHPDGTLSVFLANGQALITGGTVRSLQVTPSLDDPQRLAVTFAGQSSSELTSSLAGGRLGAFLDFRDGVLNEARNGLGLLATGIAFAVNDQHAAGMDLNGAAGTQFFSIAEPMVGASSANTGTAQIGVAVADYTQLSGSDYEVYFTGSLYEVRRLSDGALTTFSGPGPVNVDGMDLSVASGTPAAGDRFLVQPVRVAVTGLSVSIANPDKVAAALPVTVEASNANLGDGVVSGLHVVDPTNPSLRNTVRVEFTSPTSFDLIDDTLGVTLASGQSYVPGQALTVNGAEFALLGDMEAGDQFHLSDNAGATGDNRNALVLAELPASVRVKGASVRLGQVYPDLLASIGAEGVAAQASQRASDAVLTSAEDTRASVSGVNLDEEAAALLRYQQSYEAAAEVIRVAGSLFDTLLQSVRR